MQQLCDLHAHTTASDGSYTPTQLVAYAQKKGLSALAVTDHETTAGLAEALAWGREIGMRVIPGIELGTAEEGHTIHMVGLFINPESPCLREVMAWQLESRHQRNREMIQKLMDLGFRISFEDFQDLPQGTLLTRAHIADKLAQHGYGANQKEVGAKYLDQGCIGYVQRKILPTQQCIDAIHGAGGLAIVAHPNQLSRSNRDRGVEICRKLLAKGADGVEVRYCEFDEDWRQRAEALAVETGCLRSGGSDFHGRFKQGLDLGQGYGDLEVPMAFVEAMEAYRQRMPLPREA